jgi:hypothetical protein
MLRLVLLLFIDVSEFRRDQSQQPSSSIQCSSLPLVRELVALPQRSTSMELIESVADAIAAMSYFPQLHRPLVLESGVLSFLAPLCAQDDGSPRQEAALGCCNN